MFSPVMVRPFLWCRPGNFYLTAVIRWRKMRIGVMRSNEMILPRGKRIPARFATRQDSAGQVFGPRVHMLDTGYGCLYASAISIQAGA